MKVLHYTVRPASKRFYTSAGRTLCVDASEEWSARLLEKFFAGWHWSPLTPEFAPPPDALLRINSGDAPMHPRAGLESFELASGGRCLIDGETYYFEEEDSLTIVHPRSPARVEVWVGASPRARADAPLARLIFNAAMAAMRRCGLFELHGGGVVEPSGEMAVLFVGPSGSGKSTLTTQMAAAGWQYLSDDSLLLSEGGRGVEARGLRRAFAVTEQTIDAAGLAHLREATTGPVPFDPLKRRFEPREVFPSGFAHSSLPRAIFFPLVTHERESRLKALSQSEAMARLLKMSPWACYDKFSARSHLGVLSELARQSASYELFAGTDLLGDPLYAAKFLGPRLGGAR
ncbi:MAG TPA: hypothetical protein VM934_01375 [Pyrinomonadaceae bacterium]|nr:hypothetical protein [Pyrinomonadaceae bacterium]